MLDKILKSSKNPKELSMTVKGVLMQAVSFIVFAGGTLGYQVVGDLDSVVELVSAILGTAVLLIGQAQTVWGLIRKINIIKK